MEAPLFADEDDSGFSTGGLVAIAAVVIAVLCVLVFAFSDLGETDPKEVATDGQEDKVAAAEPDLTETAEPTEPDMAPSRGRARHGPPEPTPACPTEAGPRGRRQRLDARRAQRRRHW